MKLVRILAQTLFAPITAPLLLPTSFQSNCCFTPHSSPLAVPATRRSIHLFATMKYFEPNKPNRKREILQLSESRDIFIKWAVQNAIPINYIQPIRLVHDDEKGQNNDPFLSYLTRAIEHSSASVILLSEGYHNCKEMMSLHHRIIQHLSMHNGFRLVGTESGMPESRDVADYVTSADREYSEITENKEAVLWKKGLNKMYSAWVEGRELIEWMREYNDKIMQQQQQSTPTSQGEHYPQEMISYCGLDIGGFYSDWNYPISKITNYAKDHFPEFEVEWSRKIAPILDIMGNVQARYNYQHLLTPDQKSTLAVLLDKLVVEFNSHGDELGGNFEFEWAKQSAVSMQLAENYYRNYENMELSDSGNTISKYSGLDGREIAMANNMMWRLNLNHREKDVSTRKANVEKKMVVINHIIHTKTATQYQGGIWGHLVPMGQLMKQMLTYSDEGYTSERNAMFNIGMLYGSGTFWNKWQKPRERFVDISPAPDDDGMENVMKQISIASDMPNFFLHWECAPMEAWMYLNKVTTIRENDYSIRAFPLEWNGCVYLDAVSHATPSDS